LGSLVLWSGSPLFPSSRCGVALLLRPSFVCAAWGLLCRLLLLLFLLCLLLVLRPLCAARSLLFLVVLLVLLLLLLLAGLRLFLLLAFALLLRVLVFRLLRWLRVVLFRLLLLSLLLRVLCLLSRLLTLVVWCVWLVVARSVACGLLLVVRLRLLLLPWLVLSALLVLLVLPWTCGVLLVARVCLALATSVLCLLAEGFSRLAPVGVFRERLCSSRSSRLLGLEVGMVKLVLGSHSASFCCALRFLSRVAVEGDLSLGFCPYGSGSAYVSFVPVPAVAAVWAAVDSLAFVREDDGYGEAEFVANWSVGLDNARAAALESLLEAVGA